VEPLALGEVRDEVILRREGGGFRDKGGDGGERLFVPDRLMPPEIDGRRRSQRDEGEEYEGPAQKRPRDEIETPYSPAVAHRPQPDGRGDEEKGDGHGDVRGVDGVDGPAAGEEIRQDQRQPDGELQRTEEGQTGEGQKEVP
jgi:hypothetical protein